MDKQKDKLKKMLIAEREKAKGYEELARVHSAYISILLKKLKATEKNMVDIMAKDVTEALTKYESRAVATKNGFGLYYEEIKEE